MFRSSNPALRNDAFAKPQTWADLEKSAGGAAAVRSITGGGVGARVAAGAASAPGAARSLGAGAASVISPARANVMTLQGTIIKTGALLGLCVLTAVVAWAMCAPGSAGVMGVQIGPIPLALGGAVGALILCLITCAKPAAAPVTAPLHAVAEGAFVGAASAVYATMAAGLKNPSALMPDVSIVMQAGLCTFGVFGAMLTAYATRIIRPTQRFKSIVVASTMGVFFVYAASMVLRLVGVQIPFLHQVGPVGIGISGIIIVIAALNLVLDFETVETGVANGAPKHMEWYAGFSLLVTIVWLYVEILRLLWMIRAMTSER